MSDIKAVIALLCKYLKYLYGYDMKNEYFRLAKFNEKRDNTVSHFWQLLMKILDGEDQSILFNEDNVVHFVKLNFAVLDYNSLQFYALPSDMSSGSRELLLALGWLIASKNVLENAMIKKLRNSSCCREFGGLDLNSVSEEITAKCSIKNLRGACELILWYAGKVRHNLNAIEELSQEWTAIMMKIHEDTRQTCGLPHLSVGDIKLIHKMLRLKDDGRPDLELNDLKDSVTLIEIQKHWHKKDGVFWEWMESVLDEREKNCSANLNIEQKQSLANFLKILKRNLETLVREMKKSSSLGLNVKQLFQRTPEVFCGLPRFHLQDDDKTDVENLLHHTSLDITELEEKLQTQLNGAKLSLESLSKKMSELTVIDI